LGLEKKLILEQRKGNPAVMFEKSDIEPLLNKKWVKGRKELVLYAVEGVPTWLRAVTKNMRLNPIETRETRMNK
jgi:hypothetical protein